jgi:hypothetical protein
MTEAEQQRVWQSTLNFVDKVCPKLPAEEREAVAAKIYQRMLKVLKVVDHD